MADLLTVITPTATTPIAVGNNRVEVELHPSEMPANSTVGEIRACFRAASDVPADGGFPSNGYSVLNPTGTQNRYASLVVSAQAANDRLLYWAVLNQLAGRGVLSVRPAEESLGGP